MNTPQGTVFSLAKPPHLARYIPCLVIVEKHFGYKACEESLMVMEIAFFRREVENIMRILSLTTHLRLSSAFSLFALRYSYGIIVGILLLYACSLTLIDSSSLTLRSLFAETH